MKHELGAVGFVKSMDTPVLQDHSKESMHLTTMQTSGILNWQLRLLCVEELMGYVAEL